MTIKEASKLTGVSIDNLRYYERIGLIPPVPRTKSGIRGFMEIAWLSVSANCVTLLECWPNVAFLSVRLILINY